jgi:hypothetical protein
MTTIKFEQELATTDNGTSVPPKWGNKATHYFENAYGEQWIAMCNGKNLFIAGLDLGWKEIVLSYEEVKEWLEIQNEFMTIVRESQLTKVMNKMKKSNNPLFKIVWNMAEKYWLLSVLTSFELAMEYYEEEDKKEEVQS